MVNKIVPTANRWVGDPEIAAFRAGFHMGVAQAQRAGDAAVEAHMKKLAHRVMDVFENADDDALADEIMPAVFEAIGLVDAFTQSSGEVSS